MTCEALQRIMAPELEASRRKGESLGERRGEIRGERRGEIRGKILAYTDVGMSVETIAEKVALSIKEVEEILSNC